MIFSLLLFYAGKLPTDVINPILFPLLFQKNLNFFEIHPILLAKSMGTKRYFYV